MGHLHCRQKALSMLQCRWYHLMWKTTLTTTITTITSHQLAILQTSNNHHATCQDFCPDDSPETCSIVCAAIEALSDLGNNARYHQAHVTESGWLDGWKFSGRLLCGHSCERYVVRVASTTRGVARFVGFEEEVFDLVFGTVVLLLLLLVYVLNPLFL